MSVETTTAQPAVSTLPPPPPPPPPPRRPAPPDFGFQINGSFFFPRLDSTLTYQSASSPLQPPSCTFETSIFRSRHPLLFHSLSLSLSLSLSHPPYSAIHGSIHTTPLPNAPCTSALCDFECALQPSQPTLHASAMTRSLWWSTLRDSSNYVQEGVIPCSSGNDLSLQAITVDQRCDCTFTRLGD